MRNMRWTGGVEKEWSMEPLDVGMVCSYDCVWQHDG